MPAALLPCVIDSSVLIDLEAGGILRALFGLAIYPMATDFVIDELREPDARQLQDYGLVACELSADDIQNLLALRIAHSRPSISDLSSLVLARHMDALLLTSDQHLRTIAEQKGIPVHGTLWVMDEMVSHHVLSPAVAVRALRRMLERGSRLPGKECEKRLSRWEASVNPGQGERTQ
jgi:predicted nucleic acid-binding protein